MKSRGFAEGPFQMLIGIVVFGMALVIGAYLFDMVNCWKCNELLKNEGIELREVITTVGKGDPGSKKNVMINLEDLGSCAKGIYLRHVEIDSGLSCRTFCPNHPNSCWVIITESRCGDTRVQEDCVDINGNVEILYDPDLGLGTIQSAENPWLEGAIAFFTTKPVGIEKTAPGTIEIVKP